MNLEKRIDDLISKMTLEEKIGQMNLESPSIVGGFEVPCEELIEMNDDGTCPNCGAVIEEQEAEAV